ncbi:MAG: ribonuclease III domain-containing protein [Bacilli bacterium]|nr:ribonuclease III domain-containing protein [Bacilli bacterium]MDD4282437.1 ribonuclease III domain-containing protein [Bacilli bacterium]MDD4718908.1 ribonuclease III domain-containing protein [Bacilli bacterium]
MKPKEMNVLALAYLGDSIYENYIRLHLLKSGISKVNDLQKKAVNYVSARAQSEYLTKLINQEIFNEEEISIIMRARNHKSKSKPKNTDILTYKYATALEAVIGYLYLENKIEKLDKIMNLIIGE